MAKGGDGFDGDVLGGAAYGCGRVSLVPVCGIADIARRGVHHIRFLSRVIQPRAGYRDHHAEPVPPALTGQPQEEKQEMQGSANARDDVSRAHANARDTRKEAMTKREFKEVVPYARHSPEP